MTTSLFRKVCLMGIPATVAVLGFTAARPVIAITINFENDAPNNSVPNGFVSNDSPLVKFTDTIGADLEIADFGEQSDGKGLAANGDDASALKMNFLTPVNFLSLDFGNDDPGASRPGDTAELTLFKGNQQVGFVSVLLNRDDILNQTISFTSSADVDFDMATFFYNVAVPTPAGTPGLIEVVDNINFQPVPEPTTVTGLLALGAFGASLRLKRKQQQKATVKV